MVSGDEEAEAPPKKLDALKEQLRVMQRVFAKDMYDYAMAYLQKTLERLTPTEGVGDCWLLSMLAGFEITDRDLVQNTCPLISATPSANADGSRDEGLTRVRAVRVALRLVARGDTEGRNQLLILNV